MIAKHTTTRFCRRLVILAVSVMTCHSLIAAEAPSDDSLFYYKIGGGRDIAIPPSLNITTIDLSLSGQASALSCSGFDPMVAIESSLDNLRNGVDNAVNAIELAATAAIANLPGYILQKANPGLYDLFQNALLRANESFSLATKSCERIQYEIANNTNPFDEWITVSWGDSWKRSVGIGGANIHDAVDDAEDAPNEGIEWVGGLRAGGVNQPPIRVLSDVAKAGLNILSQRPPETSSNLPGSAPLAQHFAGPNAVDRWINNVLGEIEVGLCDSCTKGTRPGKGLIPYIEETTDDIVQLLVDLVSGSTQPTRVNLEQVEAPGIAVTLQVILAIRNQSPDEISIVINKLGQEIAEARVMEEAMIIRRLLLAGRKEGYVAANEIAQQEVIQALDELESEISNVIFEKDARDKFVTSTVVELLLRDNAIRQSSVNTPATVPTDPRPLKNGGVEQ
ncbi:MULTISPECIES: integrating conjugative element protein [Cycloclasticus]|jgi:integrating conjugative element protein (TIGR03755 family)|uniref:integrating conjugative element protein n=1 Tax=Cycloclasticus TaxID=34067 RepID=UPI00036EA403|nr:MULTISPECIES: integrating conjugative element protein [Cycloclasticus]ATI03742.1 integrating conjugative element protein [Cycloclasticus sp. PY97N]|tara:strand:+ start:40347 stop:41696 length:1350 start_codon:yes stop_codon:yes gene_type:complete